MPDYEDSLGDEPTYVGKAKEREEQSLGDQSTYAGSNESSLSDLDGLGGSLEDGLNRLEIVDLESRYTIIRAIGKGGMGEVFLATDTRLSRKVAIKRIKDELTTPAAAARFLTEAKSIAALSHPYIVQVYDYGRAKDGPFLIMEYVEGENLQQVCNKGVMALEDAIDLACKLCDALSKAHSLGIIHRDIKPANILMTTEGWPKITDFGLAKSTNDHGHTLTGTALGTLDFMPPEQRRDASAVDHRTDLWSLAATIYQMVTGEPPKVIDLDNVPGVLRPVLTKALKSKPEDRFASVLDFRIAIKECLNPSSTMSKLLNAGECPACRSRNETSRKFCNECGDSLRIACVGCSVIIPVWEKICGECGTNQKEAIEDLEEQLNKKVQLAIKYSQEGQYTVALKLAKSVLSKAQGRFASAESWAKEFIEVNEHYFESRVKDASKSFLIAKEHRERFEFRESFGVLQEIKPEFRNSEINLFEESLKADFNEFKTLRAEINRQLKNRELDDLDGLIIKVDRAIELGGVKRAKQKGFLRLKDSLVRRKKRNEDRESLQVKFDFEEKVSKESSSPRSVSNRKSVLQIGLALSCILGCFLSFVFYVPVVKYFNVIRGDYEAALALDPSNAEALALKKAAELSSLLDRGDYEAALTLDPSNAEALALKKAAELSSLLDRGDYEAALTLDPSNAEALALKKAADLSSLLDRGDYEAALTLDPSNAEALALKKAADLSSLLDRGDYEAALTLDPSNAEALALKKAADLSSLLDRGDYEAALTLDPSNAEALALKKAADLSSLLDRGDYEAALTLDPSNAEALALKKAATGEDGVSSSRVNNGSNKVKLPAKVMPLPTGVRFQSKQALSYQRQWSEYLGKPVEFTNSIGMEFMLIPPGEFIMGYDVNDALLSPQHKVVITKPFYLGKYEVTSGEHSFMGRNRGGGKTPALLSHVQAESFANWLRTKEPDNIYRLPTEAEWELAHRAGRVDLSQKQQVALALKSGWYKENSGGRVHEVGELPPNPYGLYDMFGNVGEAISDFHYVFPAIAKRSDPQSPATWAESLRQCKLRGENPHGPRKLKRGGNFSDPYLQNRVPWFMYSGRHSGFTNKSYGCNGARLVLEIN